jgi:hypothetical protein
VHLLVSTLNKKNAKTAMAELQALTELGGGEARQYLFMALLADLEGFLREGKSIGSPTQVRGWERWWRRGRGWGQRGLTDGSRLAGAGHSLASSAGRVSRGGRARTPWGAFLANV